MIMLGIKQLTDLLKNMGIQYGTGPCPLLWAGWWAAHGKITVSGIPNYLNYSNYLVYTQYTNVVARSIIQPGGLQGSPMCCEAPASELFDFLQLCVCL